MLALTGTGVLPLPAFAAGVVDPYAVVVPYSKRYVVGQPFAVTEPLSVADVRPTAVASAVVASGATGVAAKSTFSRS